MKLTPSQAKNLARRSLRFLVDPDPEPSERSQAFEFFADKCAYCGAGVTRKTGDLDHLVSSASGGANHISNRVPSCKQCNAEEKRESDWVQFLRHKCASQETFQHRHTLILTWTEHCGPTRHVPPEKLQAVAEQSRLLDEAFDKAVSAIRGALHSLAVAQHFAIRAALPSDADRISGLIFTQLHHARSSPEAPPSEKFLSGFTPEAIAGYINSGKYSYLVAHIAEKLVGVLGIRDHQHLYHLFVAEPVQRQGIARALWTHATKEIVAKTSEVAITVNSSLNAIGIYERFGFTAVGPRVDMDGISFVPMKCVVRHGHS